MATVIVTETMTRDDISYAFETRDLELVAWAGRCLYEGVPALVTTKQKTLRISEILEEEDSRWRVVCIEHEAPGKFGTAA
jgi:hypothetical protein